MKKLKSIFIILVLAALHLALCWLLAMGAFRLPWEDNPLTLFEKFCAVLGTILLAPLVALTTIFGKGDVVVVSGLAVSALLWAIIVYLVGVSLFRFLTKSKSDA